GAGRVLRVGDELLRAPLRLELAVGVEALHPVVPGVGDVDVAARRDRDAPRLLELAVVGALGAPGQDELAVAVELLDAVIERVDGVQRAVGRRGDFLRLGDLAGLVAALPADDLRGGELSGRLVVALLVGAAGGGLRRGPGAGDE